MPLFTSRPSASPTRPRWATASVSQRCSCSSASLAAGSSRASRANWLARQRPDVRPPAVFNWLDRVALALTAIALTFWVLAPNGAVMPWACVAAGVADGLRGARGRAFAPLGEPMLWVLHLGYGWLAIGFLLLGLDTV